VAKRIRAARCELVAPMRAIAFALGPEDELPRALEAYAKFRGDLAIGCALISAREHERPPIIFMPSMITRQPEPVEHVADHAAQTFQLPALAGMGARALLEQGLGDLSARRAATVQLADSVEIGSEVAEVGGIYLCAGFIDHYRLTKVGRKLYQVGLSPGGRHLGALNIAREPDADSGRRHGLDELLLRLRRALAGILADEQHIAVGALHLPQHGRIVGADHRLRPAHTYSIHDLFK